MIAIVIVVLIFAVVLWLAVITQQQLHVDRRWVAFVGWLLGVLSGILVYKFILPI